MMDTSGSEKGPKVPSIFLERASKGKQVAIVSAWRVAPAASSPARVVLRYFSLSVIVCSATFFAALQVAAKEESAQDYVCRLVESSARANGIPVVFLTRLIWQESSFRPGAVSRAGAQGIAQFMPGTANERGLINPFDPEQAIPKAAELLADLKRRFGNVGLAAAAYNAGPTRVADWLAGLGHLPEETRNYVLTITRRPVEDWITKAATTLAMSDAADAPKSCLQATAVIRRAKLESFASSAFVAPWGVQIAGSFSKTAALAQYERAQRRYAAILGNVKPIVLSGPQLSFGLRPYYRIRAPAPTRMAANALCTRIERAGGACAVLRN
jgi:hypothetical protein